MESLNMNRKIYFNINKFPELYMFPLSIHT